MTPMTYHTEGGAHRLVLGPTTGAFAGQRQARAYGVRIHAARRPASISVDGKRSAHWHWDAHDSSAHLVLPVESIRRSIAVTW
jgi:hypothetical protein